MIYYRNPLLGNQRASLPSDVVCKNLELVTAVSWKLNKISLYTK